MALTSKDINSLYIAIFNRVPEGDGQQYWLNEANINNFDMNSITEIMLQSNAAKEFFKGKENNEDFINHIYTNLLEKDKTTDPEGVSYWSSLLNAGMSKSLVVNELLKAAEYGKFSDPNAIKAQNLYFNKLKTAEVAAKSIKNVAPNGTINEKIAPFSNILKNITDKSTAEDIATIIKTQAIVNNIPIVSNKEFAAIIAKSFENANADQIEDMLNNLVANGFIKFNQISDKDGFLKLFEDSKILIEAKEVDYTLYKGDDGKFYKDENNKKTLVDISLDKLKISAVKLADGKIYRFKNTESKKEDEIKGYNLEKLIKNSKDGDMLTAQKASILFGEKGDIKEILADVETIVGINYTGKLEGIKIAENVIFRILDTAENLEKTGAIEVLTLLSDKIKSIDINKDQAKLNLSLTQFKSIKDKFTDSSDKTGAIKSFGAFADKLASKESVVIKDGLGDIKEFLGDSAGLNVIKSVDAIDIIDDKNALNLTLAQYSLLSDKFIDPNDSLEVDGVTGALKASKLKDVFILSKNASNLSISNFSVSDKIDFKNLGISKADAINLDIKSGASKTIEDTNIYSTTIDANISDKDYGGKNFNDLFSPSNTAFKNSTTGAKTIAIVAVKGNDITQLYRINANNDDVLNANEVSLLGILTSNSDTGVVLSDKNILTGE